MKGPFQIKKLVNEIAKTEPTKLSEQEMSGLLDVGEGGYFKDSPTSLGKSLSIVSLDFSGVKKLDKLETPFKYHRTFQLGVNMWVGDNLVGKSSIFKIIKLALTGRNSISRDVLGWITEIGLIFKLGTNHYTSLIRRYQAGNFECTFINSDIKLTSKENTQDERILFEGSLNKFEEFMQEFFFRELNYYSLQWTQHKRQKDDPSLSTANTSWATYFKSIYLEADDYNELFYGSQPELILQMLLGLELTYPINRLKVKRFHLQNELGILRKTRNNIEEQDQAKIQELKQQLEKIEEEINHLEQTAREANERKMNDKREQKLTEVKKKYHQILKRREELEQQLNDLEIQQNKLRRNYKSLRDRIEGYQTDVNKKDRAIADLQDYLQIGAFFNALEVKICPNCNHQVKKDRVQQEKETGHCRLCNDTIDTTETDVVNYERHLEQLIQQKEELHKDLERINRELLRVRQQGELGKETIEKLKAEWAKLDIEPVKQQISSLYQQLGTEKPFDWTTYLDNLRELTQKQANLKLQLQPHLASHQNPNEQQSKLEAQIQFLEQVEDYLKEQRRIRSQESLKKLEELYLKQLHSFGLDQYERVEVKSDFKITFYKNGSEFPFEEISPGEKLRTKLGLYISLIEMDVLYQLGRHPRFIIVDSPAGEEGDKFYIEGLNATLSYIQEQFGDKLQVFVGTAIRELAAAASSDRVELKAEHEFFF